MKKPQKGSYGKPPKNKIIKPNGDIKFLVGAYQDTDGSWVAEYKTFAFPKSAGKKAFEKKQQTKMKKATSPMGKKK